LQFSYDYSQLIHLTPGTAIKAVATYDNTLNKPNQPNNPPQLVTAGEETADEMMMIFSMYTAYQSRDGSIVTDSNLHVNSIPREYSSSITLFPNPFIHEAQWNVESKIS